MTRADFDAKWDKRFKDNVDFLIDEADLREFKDDLFVVEGLGGGASVPYTAAPLAAAQPAFELSPALAALGKGRLRLLLSPTTAPLPNSGFPYTFPHSLP